MARFLGVELPDNRRLVYALTRIHGIGATTAKKVIKSAGIDELKKVLEVSDNEWNKIKQVLEANNIKVEGELKQIVFRNIKQLRDIRCYRGIRHKLGLPVRGQRTRRNSHTRRGHSMPVGGLKRVLTKK